MPVAGRRPKPKGQARNRNAKAHEWTDVKDEPFMGGPKLPAKRLQGRPWPALTKKWWAAVSSMPHCILWGPADWSFALDTALLAAEFHDGDVRQATELRNREKVLGTTVDARLGLRINYVSAVEEADAPSGVTNLDDFRESYGA